MVQYKVLREKHIQGSPVGDQFIHQAIWWQCLIAGQKFVPLSWFYCRTWFGNHPLESSRVLHFFLAKNKKVRLLNFDRCILGSERETGLVLIPCSCSFFTRIPHPGLLSSLSRISFSSESRTSVENFLDQLPSKALISLVLITCTTYCFQGKGHCYVTMPIFFPANQKTFFGIGAASPVKVKSVKSRIALTFPESSTVFWENPWSRKYPSRRPGKSQNQTLAYLLAAYPATSGLTLHHH